ncbi:MAG TPA: hypothetical protein PKG77_23425 [Phycisphaerae bacterium]|nr:hypothetical protein [Phycisphaerae bacterium]HQL76300.1 hypothetical protein [Phycisphaerae bacterium]
MVDFDKSIEQLEDWLVEIVRDQLQALGAKGSDRTELRGLIQTLGDSQYKILRQLLNEGPFDDVRDQAVGAWIELCADEFETGKHPSVSNALADVAGALGPWVKKYQGLESAAAKLRRG